MKADAFGVLCKEPSEKIMLTVLEPSGGKLAAEICRRLDRQGVGNVVVLNAGSLEKNAESCDILLISADCTMPVYPSDQMPRCGMLLQPGRAAAAADSQCIVTYGMSPICTLTLSSIGPHKCVLALQREIITVSGTILDRQELQIGSGGCADDILAVSGTMLLLGLNPD